MMYSGYAMAHWNASITLFGTPHGGWRAESAREQRISGRGSMKGIFSRYG